MRESVIVSAVRTPTGKFLGALKQFTAPQLGALVVADAVRRAAIDPAIVDECIMGNVVSAGEGQNPARQAALNGGLPDHVAALTINKVCGSGLKAVMLADQGIRAGDIDIAVAGGMESMSNCPYLLPRVRDGLRMGNAEIVDSMINDGLWCAFEQCHMGNSGEVVAEAYKVGRAAQDDYAAREVARSGAARAHRRAGDERPCAEVRADDSRRSGPPRRRESRLGSEGPRSVRAERSVRGTGGCGARRARNRSGKGQRERRRRGARQCPRLEGRARC